MFTGQVQAIDSIPDDVEFGGSRASRVTFSVERGFVNSRSGPLDVFMEEFSSCRYPFRLGERYLVYARRLPSGRLSTGYCTGTQPMADAAADIRSLESLERSAPGRVFGGVHHWQRDPFERDHVDYGPVEHVVINVRGPGFSRDATTDANGRYEFTGLPAGKLTLAIIPPQTFQAEGRERDVELRTASACAEHNFRLMREARAFGIVVDASGQPVPGIPIDAIAAELAGHSPRPYQYPATTNERGIFEFENLPPGRYVFGVALTGSELPKAPPRPAVYLPGTANARDASIFDLLADERKDLGVLRLPAR